MAKRNRVRQVMKWAGLVTCIMFAAMIAVSHFRYIVFQAPYVSTLMSRGRLGIGTSRLPGVAPRESIYFLMRRDKPRGPWFPWFDSFVTLDGWNMTFIPFWLPFLALAIPTYILWRRDRRKPEGCCRECGYDLTGNESGTCPECGTKIEP